MVIGRPASFAGVALITLLLILWVMCRSAPAAVSVTGSPGSRCSESSGTLNCAHASTNVNASESEAEEPEEELEAGSEEAATAEVEAEEEETGFQAGGSPSGRAGATGNVSLSKLELTAQATAALDHHHPSASAIVFSFTLSAPSKVRVTLVRQTVSHDQKRWTALPDSLTVNASLGRVSCRLSGHNHLSPGRYRLTVRPLAGNSRSIYLSARQ
jgi:hypothetical protein